MIFDFQEDDDISIFMELFVFNNHKKIPSITDIYLKENKFRNQEKIKTLESMNNLHVGLFKIIDVNKNEGYVIYQEVFTKKEFKVIDIAMSSYFNNW